MWSSPRPRKPTIPTRARSFAPATPCCALNARRLRGTAANVAAMDPLFRKSRLLLPIVVPAPCCFNCGQFVRCLLWVGCVLTVLLCNVCIFVGSFVDEHVAEKYSEYAA